MDEIANSTNIKNLILSDFHKPRFWGIACAVIAFIIVLGWREGIAIAFAVLSIFAATYFSSKSLFIAGKSLELARASQRPFVYLLGKDIICQTTATIILNLTNTGSLPAASVSVDTVLKLAGDTIGQEEVLQENNKVVDNGTYLPNVPEGLRIRIHNSDHAKSIGDDKTKIMIAITYKNSFTKEDYQTKLCYKILKVGKKEDGSDNYDFRPIYHEWEIS